MKTQVRGLGSKRIVTLLSLSLLLVCMAGLSAALFSPQSAFAQAASFAGTWTGHYENSTGQRGDDSLALSEDQDGNLSGVWTGNVQVSGRRTGDTTAELHGRTDTRAYHLYLTAEGDRLIGKYHARRLDSSGEYDGECRFHRAR
jgi:hypothetical protein